MVGSFQISMTGSGNSALSRAKKLTIPPPSGSPYSVALPYTEKEGRTKVYRHWRFKDELMQSLDPSVRLRSHLCPFDSHRVLLGHHRT